MKIELSNGKVEINSMKFKNMEHTGTDEVDTVDIHDYRNDKYEFCIDDKINNEQEFLKIIRDFVLNMDKINNNIKIIKMKFDNNKFCATAIDREVCADDDLDEDEFFVYYHNITFDVKVIVDEEVMSKLFN